jgi:hemolysin III
MGPIAVLALLWAARHRDPVLIASVLIYGAGLIAMLGCSALYHLAESGRRKEWFRCLDHAAIFFMIAATYTPFTLNRIGGPWGIGLFAFVWLVAIFGISIKLLWPRALDGLSIVAYLLLGWSILAALDPLISAVSPEALALLIVGGLLYSLGILFHVWDRLPYQNAIWHAFVLAAASCHYAAILSDVILSNRAP